MTGTVNTDTHARATEAIEAGAGQLLTLSHTIHGNPELSWEEHDAAAAVADVLTGAGFRVETGAYDLDTAIEAVYGSGDLTVAVCAEYDALPGIGHACGHNVIAAAGVGAALGLAAVADEAGLTVKLLGTPAEEHGGGKIPMLERGAWEDVDLSVMVHGMSLSPTADPGVSHSARAMHATAVNRFQVIFTGQEAHAAGAPELGVNAGSAATLALTAIGLLRQHLPKEVNLNAFVSEGGQATNIIPGRTVVQVEIRAYDLDIWRDAMQRALKCFEGAAIATGCGWSWEATEYAYAPLVHNDVLADLWDANYAARGRTIDQAEITTGSSTDMGNVSQVVPSIHPLITFDGVTAPAHSPGFAEGAATPAADTAVIDGAVALAATVLDVACDPELRATFKELTAQRPAGSTRVVFTA